MLRRAQRVWGRILTVSGAICAFRKSAMVDVGLFDPEMAAEDIALTWKLQRRFYDVRYRRGTTSHWRTERVAVDDEAVALA